MPSSNKKFYLTTPIYYVNARPHIGHAYTTIVADVLARRHRLLGDDTFFLTGTDEHGQKIERSAAAAGIPPQEFTDKVAAEFKSLWDRMGITYDKFIRTTSPEHARGVQQLWRELEARGFIYLSSYTGSYCVSDEAFVDAPAGTPCPDCGRLLETVTEENYFFKLSEFQLPLLNLIESNKLVIENESRRNEVLSFLRGNISAAPATVISTETAQPTNTVISTEAAQPRSGEIPAFTSARSAEPEGAGGFSPLNTDPPQQGASAPGLSRTAAGTTYVPGTLKDLSISRSSFKWGIPVPDESHKKSGATAPHVIYVWLDALANYITALGYGSDDTTNFEKFWPADLHLVGKEIIRFHCVYWPAFLLAAGLPLPKAITAHGWLLFDNSKMSKSKGNIVRTETILDAFGTLCPATFTGAGLPVAGLTEPGLTGAGLNGGSSGLQPTESAPIEKGALAPGFSEPTKSDRDLFASDVLRYFLLREIPFGQDGSFSFVALLTRYNADLANGYGNLVSRTLNLIQQNFDGVIPSPPKETLLKTNKLESPKTPDDREPNTFEPFFGTDELKLNVYFDRDNRADKWWANHDFHSFLFDIARRVTFVDEYFSTFTPWKLAKQDDSTSREKLAECLYTAAESIRIITILLHPIMPYATTRVWVQLGLDPAHLTPNTQHLTPGLTWGQLKPGTKLGPLSPIFPRADKSLIETMINMEEQNARPETPLKSATTPAHAAPEPTDSTHPAAGPRVVHEPAGTLPVGGSTALTTGPDPVPPPAPLTPNTEHLTPASITIDDFAKIELRVAQIVVAERIPKADKLLRLEVDLGPDFPRRQILSGIAEHYTPEELIGRRIVVITNLAPRKMRGLESHGMLLAASNGENGKPILATFAEDIALGSRLK